MQDKLQMNVDALNAMRVQRGWSKRDFQRTTKFSSATCALIWGGKSVSIRTAKRAAQALGMAFRNAVLLSRPVPHSEETHAA